MSVMAVKSDSHQLAVSSRHREDLGTVVGLQEKRMFLPYYVKNFTGQTRLMSQANQQAG